MFRCSLGRFEYYVKNKLAKKVNKTTARLTFTPKGSGNADRENAEFYLSRKNNICCVCGEPNWELLTRHHVVPRCYRSYFPADIKEHDMHDILPLCTDCHTVYEWHADRKKQQIATQYAMPVHGIRSVTNLEQARAVTAAKSLKRNLTRIPQAGRDKLLGRIEEFLKRTPTTDDIFRLAKENVNTTMQHKTHGELVLKHIEGRAKLQMFVREWREHFVQTMQPKYLPSYWKLDTPIRQDID